MVTVTVSVGAGLVDSVEVGLHGGLVLSVGVPVVTVSVTVRATVVPALARVLADDGGASHMTAAAAAARPPAPAVAIALVITRDRFITTPYIPRVTEPTGAYRCHAAFTRAAFHRVPSRSMAVPFHGRHAPGPKA